MMDGPFFRSYTQRKPCPKVSSVPVHFVGSESDSAIKIQKVTRGFLGRENMNTIAAISNEVDEIERMVSGEMIMREAKERLRVNESIMNLLVRLDSLRSVDYGVRNCRKSVIKRAIALQEKVDQIVSVEEMKKIERDQKLERMMTKLLESNEMQSRLLSSLSHRVELLEQAFAREKLRRKKRRNATALAPASPTHSLWFSFSILIVCKCSPLFLYLYLLAMVLALNQWTLRSASHK